MWGSAVSWLCIPKAVTVIWEALFTFLDGKTGVWSFLWAFQTLVGFREVLRKSACTLLRFSNSVQ